MKRAFVFGVLAFGFIATNASGSNAPVAEGATTFVSAAPANIQLHPTLASISSAKATQLEGDKATYFVEVNNPTLGAVDLQLHMNAQTVPIHIGPKTKSGVSVTETNSALDYACKLPGRKVTFTLSGTGADTTAKTFEWSGTPQFTSSAGTGTLNGQPALPDGPPSLWTEGGTLDVAFDSCGKRPKITFKLTNGTAKTLTGLKLQMLDADGTNLGEEAIGSMGAKAAKTLTIQANAAPMAFLGSTTSNKITVKILDPNHELNANQNLFGAFVGYVWSSGIVNLKASN